MEDSDDYGEESEEEIKEIPIGKRQKTADDDLLDAYGSYGSEEGED